MSTDTDEMATVAEVEEFLIENPSSAISPVTNPSPLLQAEGPKVSDFLIPGLLGAAGLALLYVSYKKKKAPAKTEPKPAPTVDSVSFSKLYVNYTVDPGWETNVLEPYLMEQLEEGNLYVKSGWTPDIGAGSWRVYMDSSRKSVLEAFLATHTAITHDGKVLLNTLPPAKTGVIKFNAWLEEQVKNFQEEY